MITLFKSIIHKYSLRYEQYQRLLIIEFLLHEEEKRTFFDVYDSIFVSHLFDSINIAQLK